MSKTFFPESKTLKIAGEKFEIKPFVLRDRMKVMKMFTEVIADIASENPENIKNQAKLTSIMITSAGEKLIDLYQLVLGKPKEWLEGNILPKNEIEIIEAIMDINDIPFLVSRIKNLSKTIGTKLKK